MTSLLIIGGITWYACETSYFHYPTFIAWWYWPLLLATIPYYIRLSKSGGNFFHVHSWFISLSLVACLGTWSQQNEDLMFIAYFSLLSSFVSLGQLPPFRNQTLISNAFLVVGSLGITGTLLSLSFKWFWRELGYMDATHIFSSPEFIATIVTSAFAGYLLFRCIKNESWTDINLKSFAFLIFIILFILGTTQPVEAQILTNIVIFIFAVFTMISGTRQNRLSILNYGLMILTALIICRFFDTNMTFILRGLLFITVGISFFMANYYMIKKKNRPAQ
jgi:hypothetical protein